MQTNNKAKEDLELLNGQIYKEHFWNTIFVSWQSFLFKLFLAFMLSLLFELFGFFDEYSFLMAYISLEVINFNLFSSEEMRP